eukprot:Rmarinus@m.12327
MIRGPVLLFLLFLLFAVPDCNAKQRSRRKKQTDFDTVVVNARERNLVSEKLSASTLIREGGKYENATSKYFPGSTLGYVTPWNNHGYDTAKWFADKFSYVSPCWLQVQYAPDGAKIGGKHDIDIGWAREVQGFGARVVPRFVFEGWSAASLSAVTHDAQLAESLIQAISDVIVEHDFDGLVVDMGYLSMRDDTAGKVAFFRRLADIIHTGGEGLGRRRDFILVIPPARTEPLMFSHEDVAALGAYVDGFSLMTYDYSGPGRVGPNAPLSFVMNSVNSLIKTEDAKRFREKILVGLNFYGYDYSPQGGTALMGNQFIEILSAHKPRIVFDENSVEHSVRYRDEHGTDHMVYFPTPFSIEARVQLAAKLGVGISVWEIGQGLDCFFDLL